MEISTPPHDTFFALLERPELRQIGLARYDIEYHSPFFSRDVYSASVGVTFDSHTEAYSHWLAFGRQEGHEWAHGRDTLLKIILKAKDEPYLIDAWIAHHAAIVGYENLIILDCGSHDHAYIEKLAGYASRILILDYRQVYDNIHAPRSNADFFRLLSANCRYLTILDADEFLFAEAGNLFSGQFVKSVLRARDLPMFCGIWVTATAGGTGLSDACSIDVSPDMLLSGAVAGKAVARHDIIFRIGHLGHNLHVPDVLPFIKEDALGEILVLHMKNLPREVMRDRVVKHLIGKGVLGATTGPDRDLRIASLAEASDAAPAVRAYAQAYLRLGREHPPQPSEHAVPAALINATSPQSIPALTAALARMDWVRLLQQRHALLAGAA